MPICIRFYQLELDKKLKEEGIKEEDIKEGKEESIREGKYTVAKRLFMKGQGVDTVMDVTELTREEVEKLIREMQD
jgi:hypothetical protein